MTTAPSLTELQSAFYARVMHGDEAILPWVVSHGLPATKRMQIYQHIVENTLSEALRTSYPAIVLLVGAAFFDQAADRYMRHNPPQVGNLQTYGAQFPMFLAQMKEAASLPYLADMARLEWARQQAYLAGDAQALGASEVAHQLQQFENKQVYLTLHPSVQCIHSSHRIVDIWHYCMNQDGETLQLEGDGQSVLLWRDGVQVAMQVIDAPAAGFLCKIREGMDMHHALQQETPDQVVVDLSALLPFLIANTMIVSIHTEATP